MDDDVILSTAVQSNVDLENVEAFGELRFRLTGVDLTGFDLTGGRQRLSGDTLIIQRERWDDIEPGYSLPYKLMDLSDDSPLKGPILTIQKSGERAAAIVQDLLTLARRGVATMEAIDLNRTVSEYLASPEFSKLCSFHPRVTVDRHLDTDLLPISVDR